MPSRQALHNAIRYLLQLGVELENGADTEERAVVLSRVVGALERHRTYRKQRRQKVLLAELVPLIMRRFERENRKGDFTSRSVTVGWLATRLRERGITLEVSDVAALLERDPRPGANRRTRREKLLDQLAFLAETSQSDLEKLFHVMAREADGEGPLGTAAARDAAATDEAPPTSALLEYVVDVLGIDPTGPYDLEQESDLAWEEAKLFARAQVTRARQAAESRSRTAEFARSPNRPPRTRKTAKKKLRRSR